MRSTLSRWRRLRISSQSRHSERTVRTKRSAIAFAFGARTLRLHDPDAFAAEDLVEGAAVLAIAVADQEADACSEKSRPRLRACWVTQAPVGLAVQPASQTRRLPWAMKNSA